jgi:hypothetical protein
MPESAEDLLPADPVVGEVDWLRRPGAPNYFLQGLIDEASV